MHLCHHHASCAMRAYISSSNALIHCHVYGCPPHTLCHINYLPFSLLFWRASKRLMSDHLSSLHRTIMMIIYSYNVTSIIHILSQRRQGAREKSLLLDFHSGRWRIRALCMARLIAT